MITIQSQEFARRLHARGLPLGNWLGSAGWGVVFQNATNPRRVFKVTQMLREAEASLWVKQQQRGFNEPAHPCLPVIYAWEQDQDKDLKHPKGAHTNFWIIEREELQDLRLNTLVNLPLARSTRENLIFDRIADALFQAVESATMIQQAGDVERLAFALMQQTLLQLEEAEWSSVQTQGDAEIAERLGEVIQVTHRQLGRQMRRLAEFAAYCTAHGRVLGDVNHWNWGLRPNSEIVVRDLGGFLARQYRHGPFEGLGTWNPKVIKGERDGHWLAKRVPDAPEKVRMFETGFEAGLNARATEITLEASREYRDGYAVGRESRGDEKQITFVYSIIESRLAAAAPSIRPSAGRRSVTRTSRPPSGHHGPRMNVREVARHFAHHEGPAKSSGGLWTDGVSAYSYKQLIAQKRKLTPLDTVCYVEKRRFSKTTSKHQNILRTALEFEGWKIMEIEFP